MPLAEVAGKAKIYRGHFLTAITFKSCGVPIRSTFVSFTRGEKMLFGTTDLCGGLTALFPEDGSWDYEVLLSGETTEHQRFTGTIQVTDGDPINRTIDVKTYVPRSLVVRTSRTSFTGYGQIGEAVGRLLDARGFPARFLGMGADGHYLPVNTWVGPRTVQAPPRFASVLQVSTPQLPPLSGRRTVFLTMWESTRIRPEWAPYLDRAEAVIVPCRFNADGFRASGVTAPIHVVPLGIEPRTFNYRLFPLSGPFTFGMAARMSHGGIRKGLNEGMAAFTKAFDRGEDVRLKIKVFEDCLPFLKVPDDLRIEVSTEPMTPEMMADWYETIFCLLVPSKGEGWGLHTLQAMACGRPVIACKQSGTAEFFDGRFGWEVPFTMQPAGEFYAGMGEWAVPSEDGMIEAMRQAFRSPGRVYSRGLAASRQASLFTWERTGDKLLEALSAVPGFLPPSAYPEGTPCAMDTFS